MSRSERHGVFVSYARADGEVFSEHLQQILATNAPEILVRWDRTEIQGGERWWQTITKSIDAAEFVVLVLTPKALASDIVRKEWLYARHQGVSVIPVNGGPGTELPNAPLPSWMRKRHIYNLERELASFIQQLRTPSRDLSVPFMAPDAPGLFIPRASELLELNSIVLRDRQGCVLLSGAGGAGKTTLARVFCHQPEIEEEFDDGVLWTSLGPDPNPTTILGTLYAALTNDRPGFFSENDASFHLSEVLDERRLLIVLDDVWDSAHVRPFLRGGPNCARLIISSKSDLLPDAARISLGEMNEEESIALFAPMGLPRDRIQALNARLGNWPLALELARAMLSKRINFGEAPLTALNKVDAQLQSRGVTWLKADTDDQRHRSIEAAMEISLKLLSSRNPAAPERLAELSIFPESVSISFAAIEPLWQLDSFEAEELVQDMAALSLLKLDLRARTVRLHKIIRDLLKSRAGDPTMLHSRIVDGWGDWHNLPDVYAWQWLPWHLNQAQRSGDVNRILWDPRWLRQKLEATDMNSLIRDFDNLASDPDAVLVRSALRLSAHVVARDKSQLIPQLAGRLFASTSPKIRNLTRFDDSLSNVLRPISPALRPPGTALIRTLVGHRYAVQGVAVFPDGKRAISASWDRTLIVWDLDTGQEAYTLAGHTYPVSAVAVYGNGMKAISSSADRSVRIWDLNTRKQRLLGAHAMAVSSIAIDPAGTRALSGSWDHTLKIWDLEAGELAGQLVGHAFWVSSVAFIGGGKRALSTSWDRTIKIWDVSTKKIEVSLVGHQDSVFGAAAYADDTRLISASADHTLKIWDLRNGGIPTNTLAGHGGSVTAVATFADGTRAISASEDKTLKLWSLEPGGERLLRTLSGHGSKVLSVTVCADGKRAISASQDRTLKIWDLETGETALEFLSHGQSINAIAVDPVSRVAISASSDWDLRVWNLDTASCLFKLSGHHGAVTAVIIYAEGKRAVSASKDRTLREWDLQTGKEVQILFGHNDAVTCVCTFPGESIIISGSADCTVRLWDLKSGTLLARYFADNPISTCEVDRRTGQIIAADSVGGLHFLEFWRPDHD